MKFKLACQTLTKQGKRPCMAPGILCKNGNIRCKVHGGYSRGPTTLEGKAKSENNMHHIYIAVLCSLMLKKIRIQGKFSLVNDPKAMYTG